MKEPNGAPLLGLLDRRALAQWLTTSEATIERLEREGLPCVDIAPVATRGKGRAKRLPRFDRSEVLEWLRARKGRL